MTQEPCRLLMGVEKEYAAVGVDSAGNAMSHDVVGQRVVAAVAKLYPHMRCAGSVVGIWPANGGRIYVDAGGHPEGATPECADPWQTVRYERSIDRMVQTAVESLNKNDNGCTYSIFTNNCDYRRQSTWGSHENYLYRGDQAEMARQIIPLLVARVVLTGAGGFDPFVPLPMFSISPRVGHLRHVSSGASTHNRGIFHRKDEALAAHGYRRLHLLCGESLRSETSAVLRVGLTALAVALIEAGCRPGDAVQLNDPLAAIRAFADDPTCTAAAPCRDGRSRTALDILSHYLSMAVEHTGKPFMPDWTGDLVVLGAHRVDALGHGGVEGAGACLNWAIKHAVFTRYIASRGYDWDRLNELAAAVRPAQPPSEDEDDPAGIFHALRPPLDPDPADRGHRRLTRVLSSRGLSRRDQRDLLALRAELHEIDWRLAQLGGASLFESLDRRGALDHRLSRVGDIDRACHEPPPGGRAQVRGRFVHEHAGDDRYVCDWATVFDLAEDRRVDLADPFETDVRWKHNDSPGVVSPHLHVVLERRRRRFAESV